MFSQPVKANPIGGKSVGVIIKTSSQETGLLEFTMDAYATGLIESLPFLEYPSNVRHDMYAYLPYEPNTSSDPTHIQVKPIPALQTQDGTNKDHLYEHMFHVSDPTSYDLNSKPLLQFMHAYTNLYFIINSNIDGLVVKSVTLKAPDAATIAFSGGYTDITLRWFEDDFAKVTDIEDPESTVKLNITGGLPIPNSTTYHSTAYMVINPSNIDGQVMTVIVETTDGKEYTFDVEGQDFRKGMTYEIPLRIESKPEVSLQWSVSTTTDDIASFTDVINEKTTTVDAPGPVYLQIRPETRNLNYDRWEIDYTAVPSDYFYAVPDNLGQTDRFNFNEGNPHRSAGTYTYTVTGVRFYKGISEVHSVSYDAEPYKHTIRINRKEEPDPEPDVNFQWSVSTTAGDDGAFDDVRNMRTTQVTEPTPVYLRIRPVVTGPLEFDSWEISYTAVPQDYEFTMTPEAADSPYGFNNGNAHVQTGTYTYTVNSFTLYKNGRVVMDGWGYYQHTIIIDENDDPDPIDPTDPETPVDPGPPVLPPDPIEPDPDTDHLIVVRPPSPLCSNDLLLSISFMVQYKEEPLEYALLFTDEAKAVGFEDDSVYSALPQDGFITIPVKGSIPKGTYSGYIMVRIKGKTETELYQFRIQMLDNIRITEQPIPVNSRCEGDGLKLWVETEGDVLSYQWYRNGEIIPAATDSIYEAVLDNQVLGDYYVEVKGYCNTDISNTVAVKMNTLKIQLKWDDVMYLTNTDGKYTIFQWYKNGQSIDQHGKSIYYTDPNGLLGDYYVRAYKADGSYDETCPVSFMTITKAPQVSVYPNPVQRSGYFTVEGEELTGSVIEVYDFYGRRVNSKKAVANTLDMVAPTVSGMYVVRIIHTNGRITTLQLLVKD